MKYFSKRSLLILAVLLVLSYGCSANQAPSTGTGSVLGIPASDLPPAPESAVEGLTYVKLVNQAGTLLNGATVDAGKIFAYGWVDEGGNFTRDPSRSDCFYVAKFTETDCLTSLRIQMEADGKTIKPKASVFGVTNGHATATLWITGTYDAQAAIQYQIRWPGQSPKVWNLPMVRQPAN